MKATASVKMILDTRYQKQNSDTFPVRLRVTHNRQQKYFATKFSMTEKAWSKMTGSRPDELKDTLYELQDLEKRATKIIDTLPSFSFETLKNKLSNSSESHFLTGEFNNYILDLRAATQIGTALNYECARESLLKF